MGGWRRAWSSTAWLSLIRAGDEEKQARSKEVRQVAKTAHVKAMSSMVAVHGNPR